MDVGTVEVETPLGRRLPAQDVEQSDQGIRRFIVKNQNTAHRTIHCGDDRRASSHAVFVGGNLQRTIIYEALASGFAGVKALVILSILCSRWQDAGSVPDINRTSFHHQVYERNLPPSVVVLQPITIVVTTMPNTATRIGSRSMALRLA